MASRLSDGTVAVVVALLKELPSVGWEAFQEVFSSDQILVFDGADHFRGLNSKVGKGQIVVPLVKTG